MLQRAIWWLLLLPACGGVVEGGTRDPEGGAADGGAGSTSTSASPPSKSNETPGHDNPNADTELGDCSLGRPEAYDDMPCPWVAKNRCYEEREMACNCACPRTRNSACVSGFDDGPQGHVKVSCD